MNEATLSVSDDEFGRSGEDRWHDRRARVLRSKHRHQSTPLVISVVRFNKWLYWDSYPATQEGIDVPKGIGGPTVIFFEPSTGRSRFEGNEALRAEFERLSKIWKRETLASSSLQEIGSHWAYQRIIGLGPDVIPMILEHVQRGDRHWGWALAALTGINPAERTDSQRAAAEAWLAWGRKRGLVGGESESERVD